MTPQTTTARRTSKPRRLRSIAAVALALGLGATLLASPAAAAKSKKLVGLFGITAGADADDTVTGSYFRMVEPNGTVADGPFIANADSPATDKTYTLLSPGEDGGLVTREYQPQPEPPFDDTGNGTAAAIVAPTKFFGVQFALATNETDPQTSEDAKAPSIKRKGKKLSGDLAALGVAYGKQHFNQGSPKPDGSKPEGTAGPKGTFDAETGEYTLDWSSAIVGGPFNGFTGVWHLEGTFEKQ